VSIETFANLPKSVQIFEFYWRYCLQFYFKL